jgi:hypothetical protein
MTWKAIVSFRLHNDEASAVRNKLLVPKLKDLSLENTATGTWEAGEIDQKRAANCMKEILEVLADPQAKSKEAHAVLQHLWVYIAKDDDLKSGESDRDQ